ncbi:MAG: hypothetical protein NVSMB27_20740 [Ktedonobacteraceae bacterium]
MAESQTEKASNDYDLTLARIIVTPVLVGLAAAGGVLLTAMLCLTLVKSSASSPVNSPLGLADIYNLSRNEFGIVIAAVFGYTANLFINVLRDKATNITNQLQNTSASDQGK